jgi:hypothetical protein
MAFIAIDGDTSWQDLAIAEELAESYNLRRQVFGLSTIATPTQATQVYTFVRALQEGIEEMMGYDYFGYGEYYGWLLNTAALSTYAGQTSFPSPMTLSSGMTAAGLTASGYWRRIAEGGSQPATWTNYGAAGWSYGKITDKDLAGPWLWKDIQLALSVLTRAQLPPTQSRRKTGSYTGAAPIPSTSMSFGSWSNTLYSCTFNVSKTKTGSSVTSASASCYVVEHRCDISATPAACESARLILTMPWDSLGTYATNGAKVDWANLGERNVKTIFLKTVSNTSSKSTSGATTSYNIILAEDASNLVPLANDILPDSNVPSDSTRSAYIFFDVPWIIIDFVFE